jgi:predicted deacylase
MRLARLPLTYDESRARFARAAAEAGVGVASYPLAARGPGGQELAIDVVSFGATAPEQALVVLSGVHGVEGYLGSALQSDLLVRLAAADLPAAMAVVLVHAVNPWGMAWWRRQNESNVDLNRNWRRSDTDPVHNDAYDVLHPLACPDTPELPSVDGLLEAALSLVEEHGLAWVRDGITVGQYRHRDGLHFGGDRTEASSAIVERVVAERLAGIDRMLTIDLHSGHGAFGDLTLLCDAAPDSPQEGFLRSIGGADALEATIDNPDATTGVKSAQIANGLADLFPQATCFSTTAEFGTVADDEMLVTTYLESWVHRHGSRTDPVHRDITWRYRCCFTPDDPAWEDTCAAKGSALLDAAVAAVASWPSAAGSEVAGSDADA